MRGGVTTRVAAAAALGAIVMAAGLTSCGPLVRMETPAPDGPRISRLAFHPTRPLAGCPVSITVHLDVGARDEMRAGVGWARLARRSPGSGYKILAVRLAPSGDATVSIVADRRWGTYSYHVQIGDQEGRWSNVLSARVVADASPGGETPRCSWRADFLPATLGFPFVLDAGGASAPEQLTRLTGEEAVAVAARASPSCAPNGSSTRRSHH
jgi:hypothetical protein